MARQEGIIKLSGTIGDITFYKTEDGYLAKGKGGPGREQVLHSASFKRTRENGGEFGVCVKKASLFKRTVWSLARAVSDARVSGRLNGLMYRIKELDTTSARGERKVENGIGTAAAKELLSNFRFSRLVEPKNIFRKPVVVDINTHAFSVTNLECRQDISYPPGATHVRLTGGIAVINFQDGSREFIVTNSINLNRNAGALNVTLMPASQPTLAGTVIYLLQVLFMQEVNGTLNELNDKNYSCLMVVAVK